MFVCGTCASSFSVRCLRSGRLLRSNAYRYKLWFARSGAPPPMGLCDPAPPPWTMDCWSVPAHPSMTPPLHNGLVKLPDPRTWGGVLQNDSTIMFDSCTTTGRYTLNMCAPIFNALTVLRNPSRNCYFSLGDPF